MWLAGEWNFPEHVRFGTCMAGITSRLEDRIEYRKVAMLERELPKFKSQTGDV
jgi:hypothetical protein